MCNSNLVRQFVVLHACICCFSISNNCRVGKGERFITMELMGKTVIQYLNYSYLIRRHGLAFLRPLIILTYIK